MFVCKSVNMFLEISIFDAKRLAITIKIKTKPPKFTHLKLKRIYRSPDIQLNIVSKEECN